MNKKGSMTASAIAITIIALIIGVVIGIGAYPSIFPYGDMEGDIVPPDNNGEHPYRLVYDANTEVYGENVVIMQGYIRSPYSSVFYGDVTIHMSSETKTFRSVYYQVYQADFEVAVYVSDGSSW